jgi:glycosyltransferase involved in cell wall biosynthesis
VNPHIVTSESTETLETHMKIITCFNQQIPTSPIFNAVSPNMRTNIENNLSINHIKMIILNMIVKNETHVIERCFNSVKDVIDAIVISDTGSTDDTIAKMEKWRQDNNKQGQIVSHEWKNFEHNRNLALLSCQIWIYSNAPPNQNHYIIFLDADDYIVIKNLQSFANQLKNMKHDKYMIPMHCGNSEYGRLFAIKAPKKGEKVTCKWEGVLHEYLNRDGTTANLTDAYIQASHEGARGNDPMKYLKDAIILETALKQEPNNSRYVFYLAQSYRDYGEPLFKKMAEKIYLKRFDMGGWDEERYIALLEAAKCRLSRGKDDDKTLNLLIQAFNFRPNRLEAPYYIVRHFRLHDKHIMGYMFGKPLISMPWPTDVLFVDIDIHTWMFYDEVGICCTWAQDKKLYRVLCNKILAVPNLNPADHERISRDLKTYG